MTAYAARTIASLFHSAGPVMGRIVARGFDLVCLLHETLAEARQAQAKFEAERLRGGSRLSSRHDGDLPIVR
jgi:hypothetical protein